jgi:hypothetical protein
MDCLVLTQLIDLPPELAKFSFEESAAVPEESLPEIITFVSY